MHAFSYVLLMFGGAGRAGVKNKVLQWPCYEFDCENGC